VVWLFAAVVVMFDWVVMVRGVAASLGLWEFCDLFWGCSGFLHGVS